MSTSSWLWLVVLWGATGGVVGSLIVIVWLQGQLRAGDDCSNVIVLPPRATRSGPTHVVRCSQSPVLFDFEAQDVRA